MSSSGNRKISVVITVLNEESQIVGLLDSLNRQALLPNEVLITDAGSTDATVKLIKQYKAKFPLKIIHQQGNRSVGRNAGIAAAKNELIAITDAGCFPRPLWLSQLMQPFKDSQVDVVAGYYAGRAHTNFEKSLLPYVLVMPDRIPATFLPSTRSMAIKKTVWAAAGKFNEHVDPSEDYEFALRLQQQGFVFAFAPDAIVDWVPRHSLVPAAKMFASFAYGDMVAGILRPKVKFLLLRYAVGVFLFMLGFDWRWSWLVLGLSLLAYLVWAIVKNYAYVKDISALWYLPLLQVTSDLCVIVGTLAGIVVKMGT